jgi:hypothetical protein
VGFAAELLPEVLAAMTVLSIGVEPTCQWKPANVALAATWPRGAP